jgi:hypothetical protein
MSLSIRVALLTFAFGFVVEGVTEAYQFFTAGYLGRAWVGLYYIGLFASGVGFFLIYQGRHELTELHLRNVLRGRRFLGAAVGIFAAATVAIAILGAVYGGSGQPNAPIALIAIVGGAVALSFGNFFLSLVLIVRHLVSRSAEVAAWAGFAWSLGVAVLTGWVVGDQFPTLLHEFFSNPLELIVSFAPLAFVMAPLFVTYFLFAGVYWDADRHMRLLRPGTAPADPMESSRSVPVELSAR